MQCAYCGYNYASPCYGKSAECMNKLAVDAKTGSRAGGRARDGRARYHGWRRPLRPPWRRP